MGEATLSGLDPSVADEPMVRGVSMKHLKHPATVIAALALFVAVGGGATASVLISGTQIKNHSIAAKKRRSMR